MPLMANLCANLGKLLNILILFKEDVYLAAAFVGDEIASVALIPNLFCKVRACNRVCTHIRIDCSKDSGVSLGYVERW